MIVSLVQHSKDIEDKVAVKGHAAEIAKVIDYALHLTTVVTHQEITLD
jgi:hypothetical protein